MSELKQKIMDTLMKHLQDGSKDLPRDIRVERKDVTNFAVAGLIRPELLKAIAPEEADKIEKRSVETAGEAKRILAKMALGVKADGSPITPSDLAKCLRGSQDRNVDAIVKSLVDDGAKPTVGAVAILANLAKNLDETSDQSPETEAKEFDEDYDEYGLTEEEVEPGGGDEPQPSGDPEAFDDPGEAEALLCKQSGCKSMAKDGAKFCKEHGDQ